MSGKPTYEELEKRVLELEAIAPVLNNNKNMPFLQFEKHDAIILFIEPDSGVIVNANIAAQNFYGYSQKIFKQMKIQDINMLTQEEVALKRKQAINENLNYFEFPHQLSSGEIRTVEVHSSPIELHGKKILISIIHDITARKQAEMKLLESERNMASVLNNTQDIVVRIDRNFRNIFANPTLYTVTGLTPEQYLGKTNKEIGMPEALCDFWRKKHDKVFNSGVPEIIEFSFPTVNNDERVLQAIISPEIDDCNEVKTVISYIRDVTDFKLAETEKNIIIEKLEKTLAELVTAQQHINQLEKVLPICSNCKKIRDKAGNYMDADSYIIAHTESQVTHGLCPDCIKKLYPEVAEDLLRKKS